MRRHYFRDFLALSVCVSGLALNVRPVHAQAANPLHARIAAVAAEEGFEASVALALISIESAFDSVAIGKGGPLGLMQVKLGTASLVMPGIKRSELFEPEKNVRVGLRYLHSLMEKYSGDLETALRAYKNGPRAVDAGKAPTPATLSYLARFRRAQTRYAAALPSDTASRIDNPHRK